MIDDVIIKRLQTHCDERGFFREMIRVTDTYFDAGFGQLSHSLVNEGVLKAWHGHKLQTQWNYVVTGLIKVALYDNRENSSTKGECMKFHCGDGEDPIIYMFPPGVLHGYKCIKGPMNIIYITSGTYDINEEVRVSMDELSINYKFEEKHVDR